MALLYERSALWRAIVNATRDPRVLVLFTLTTGAAGYAIGKGSQMVTATGSDQTKDEMEKKLKKDVEAARYARHSKNALAVMLDSVGGENDKHKKNEIKLPGVMWHPKVMEQEKRERLAKEKAAGAVSEKREIVASSTEARKKE